MKPKRISDIAPAAPAVPEGAGLPEGGPVGPLRPVRPVTNEGSGVTGRDAIPDQVKAWLARFICPLNDLDLDLLTLWILHTHLVEGFYTTPRLVIDSPLPESGKTTTLEHLERLCMNALQMAALSSPAMLARILDTGMKTLLVDEVEKNLRPDRPGVEDLLAVLNTGYKRGGSRPVLVPGKEGKWDAKQMPTFSPLAMAGISPNLPDDTLSRAVTVMLLPDTEGVIEDSDWEFIEPDALRLADQISRWSDEVQALIAANDHPELPDACRGRSKEKWRPLKRVADAAGGRWPDVCWQLIQRDLDNHEHDREEGLMTQRPAIALVRDMLDVWPEGQRHWPTDQITAALIDRFPDRWGPSDRYPRGLTSQRVGRYLGKQWGIRSQRAPSGDRERGYLHADLARLAHRAGLAGTPQIKPDEPAGLAELDAVKPCVIGGCTNPRHPGRATCTHHAEQGDSA